MLSGIFLEDQTWHHLWSRMPHFHRHAMLSVIPSFVFWGLISSFLVSVAGRLLAQDACEDTPTHTLTCRLMCTNKCRLKHMRSDHLCVMTRTEDGRFIWLRETTREGEKQSDQRRGEGGREGLLPLSFDWFNPHSKGQIYDTSEANSHFLSFIHT